MLNHTTILRLHFPPGAPEMISAVALGNLADALENFAERIAASVGLEKVNTFLVAAPRKGSLEFHFRVDLKFRIASSAVLKRLLPKSSTLSTLADASAIGALLWAVIFAPGGILEYVSPFVVKSSARTELHGAAVKNLAQYSSAGQSSITGLTAAAARTGAARVEIQLPDEPPVVIYDNSPRWKSYRPEFSKFSLWNATADMYRKGESTAASDLGFTRSDDVAHHVRLNDQDYQAFVARCYSGLVLQQAITKEPLALILWPVDSALPTPRGKHMARVTPATSNDTIKIPDGAGLDVGRDTIFLVAAK